ncbi:hypothetical protein DZK27_16800 [Rhodobacteraceae bacterium 63075]|nr:hypothetical protein DZK27_16800 [Rhodobacteraceae bacterium 63075]
MAMTGTTKLFRVASAAALALGVTSLAASAQENVWKWTSSPQQTAQGGHCWMGIGHAGRKFSLHATSGVGNFIGIDSPVLTGLTGVQEGWITFAGDTPQGQRYTLRWNKGDPASQWLANGIGEEGVIAILQGFIMTDTFGSGMSISLGGSETLSFPASGVSEAVEGYGDCSNQL